MGNSFRCPIVLPDGTNLLFQACHEDVVFLVIVISATVFAVGVIIWLMTKQTDITVPPCVRAMVHFFHSGRKF